MNKSGGALGVQKAELSGEAGSETTKDAPLKDSMYYIGLDIHKKTISYCVKDQSGQICVAGIIPATRGDLDRWMNTLPQPWTAAMEATMFTGWIYDHLVPHAPVKVTHPLMLRAIAAAKKKNDRIDLASSETRERRRTLRYRNLLVPQTVQCKNKSAGLPASAGCSCHPASANYHPVRFLPSCLEQSQLPACRYLSVLVSSADQLSKAPYALYPFAKRGPRLAPPQQRLEARGTRDSSAAGPYAAKYL